MSACGLNRSAFSGCKLSAPPLRRRRASRHAVTTEAVTADDLWRCRRQLTDAISRNNLSPLYLRLAFHDAGTYDRYVGGGWPICGGANGSICSPQEYQLPHNAGLEVAMPLLNTVKNNNPGVSYADLVQMSGVIAVQVAGGPIIRLHYNRMDANQPDSSVGRLPEATRAVKPPGSAQRGYSSQPPPPNQRDCIVHLREKFYRMGLDDKDIVALSGGHTLGRALQRNSGFGVASTQYTYSTPGGGTSWTRDWLRFDNSYFVDIKAQRDPNLLLLDTDEALVRDRDFSYYVNLYAADQQRFFADYSASHYKMSELGVRWGPGGPMNEF